MDITTLISDIGFPIVVSLILIVKIENKLDTILAEIRKLNKQNKN